MFNVKEQLVVLLLAAAVLVPCYVIYTQVEQILRDIETVVRNVQPHP